ncbi:MAG TPA: hypothetical protein PKW30_04505 [Campylobacterales bacterium]|nr:hypothetical protein [Campylobacterales bacterium]
MRFMWCKKCGYRIHKGDRVKTSRGAICTSCAIAMAKDRKC